MKYIYKYTLLVSFFTILASCTDLQEVVLDESFTGSGLSETISGAIAPAYGQISWTWRHTNYYGLQLIAADEAILPHRGGTDWFDGGKFLAVHAHTTTPTNDLVSSSWNELSKNISRTLTAIETLTPLAEMGNREAESALYEMKALRGYLNLLMLDSWGLIFKKERSTETSEILRGQAAVNYLDSEFQSVVNVINTDLGSGRMTQGAVWGFLARLHLNAPVYRDPYGTPSFTDADMDKVIEYTTNVISSGTYQLSPGYFEMFNDENRSNPELIFALDQRGVLRNEESRWTYWSLAGSLWGRPEFPSSDGTDGPAITPDFYQTWVDAYGDVDPAAADIRFYQQKQQIPAELRDLTGLSPANDENHYYCTTPEDYEFDRGIIRGVIWGPRKDASGAFFRCDGNPNVYRIYPVIQTKGNGPDRNVGYVNHELQIDFTNEGRLHSKGYRVSKYQFSRTSPNANDFSSVDIVLMRLAEMYLMRAEAQLRKGNNAAALADLNTVRTSRTAHQPVPAALPAVDLEVLYRELGFEFYWEGLRRTNQIRFGKYEDAWTEKTDATPTKRLFPIPQSAIDGASNTPGYLEQNAGY
ncbi:RagB/SusD family nutrient uptake outer membrane protein [Neolewinella lacunae]|uniref:RagB/SusD family nutrient uptake outer membrane protein n=1 Tax=Neolewinella lacunae TaxID=1517758 RepID=A0A923PEZ2_9BACT|nr:RagB/SusD family nutrient uptake outer membrane protein [Neolewinella lacunae]MBC6992850.1 RagB/SusD family nutrient uptake outer membrane protein [Neolewinella lacunae]MDN3633786.1 RagB/SusD family nutrient uptake outer membrane protein [Neolewinella lacunae]